MNFIPQMMPIKWFMIYFIYLIVFYMFIMLMNSFLIKFNLKFKKTSKSLKKWNWLW